MFNISNYCSFHSFLLMTRQIDLDLDCTEIEPLPLATAAVVREHLPWQLSIVFAMFMVFELIHSYCSLDSSSQCTELHRV